jgi:hypothetical protein
MRYAVQLNGMHHSMVRIIQVLQRAYKKCHRDASLCSSLA